MNPDLYRVVLDALTLAWAENNRVMFRGRLRRPILALGTNGPLGCWVSTTRTLTIDRTLAATAPWGRVIEVLRHEMAHQFVNEALGVNDETAHGPAFRRVCERFSIDSRATGLPEGGAAAEPAVLRRIRKLLALAESPEQNEAAAAMAAARRLMAANPSPVSTEEALFTSAWVGPIRARRPLWERQLGGLLTTHFRVSAIWVPALDQSRVAWGDQLEVNGIRADVDVAGYVWDFVAGFAERSWRSAGGGTAPARNRYCAGVITGFHQKLDAAKAVDRAAGLVYVGPAGLDAWMHARHPSIRHQRLHGGAADPAWSRGHAAGSTLEIRPGIHAGAGAPRGALPGA